MAIDVGSLPPTAKEYAGETSFFAGTPPISQGLGYLVILGFGAAFSIFSTLLIYAIQQFGVAGRVTSEQFK
jgi:urea-proton symporter